MTDNELLLAISNMISPIREDVQGLKQDVRELKQDVQGLKQDVKGLKQDVKELKQDVADLKVRVKKIELTQENEILPRLNTIESCYTSTYERYRDSVEEHEAMKQDITVIKNVLMEHSEKLNKLA